MRRLASSWQACACVRNELCVCYLNVALPTRPRNKRQKAGGGQRKRKKDGPEKVQGADFLSLKTKCSHVGICDVWDLSGIPVATLDGLGKSGMNPPKLFLEQMWKLRPKETKDLIVYFGRGILQRAP